jgi:hypothetical protein
MQARAPLRLSTCDATLALALFGMALTRRPPRAPQGQTMNAGAMLVRRSRRAACVRGATVASAAPPKRRVVVTGMGCITSLGHDKTTFYKCVASRRRPLQRVSTG